MGSISALLSTARDALTSYAGAIDITGRNVTNANTPGAPGRYPR